MLATGTIPGSITRGGQDSFELGDKKSRVYIEDGDEIHISALASDGVGFGECIGKVLPAYL